MADIYKDTCHTGNWISRHQESQSITPGRPSRHLGCSTGSHNSGDRRTTHHLRAGFRISDHIPVILTPRLTGQIQPSTHTHHQLGNLPTTHSQRNPQISHTNSHANKKTFLTLQPSSRPLCRQQPPPLRNTIHKTPMSKERNY